MKELTKLLQAQFEKMCATGKLFKSSLSGEEVWKLYLSSFKNKQDKELEGKSIEELQAMLNQ